MTTLLEMKQKSTREHMKIMQAFLDGKIILSRLLDSDRWHETRYPSWNFTHYEYKVLGEEPTGHDAEEEARVA